MIMLERSPASTSIMADVRPQVRGKFLFLGDEKFYVRGVTYGPFRPDEDGSEYHDPDVVGQDFAQIAANGFNAVRTYTVPPRWLLDIAQQHGLRVMVGLPWEQHVAFLDGSQRSRSIEERVRAGVRACAGHPAVLCYAIGNEIPASIVRWYGRRRVERFLQRLYAVAKAEDPDGLVTYVNYPSTEYLQLPFVDFVCFNVYLEDQDRLDAYLARLQNLAGDRPLLLAEIGLDSRRNGLEAQAQTLDWQVRTAFAAGCAGAFVFAWTDEWHRGGHDIDDWDFGLTDRKRWPKPALAAVREAFAEVPFSPDLPWPRISVVVCSYNGGRTIRECCEALRRVDYPNFEVIVVDDGSTDATAAIAREYGFRVISTENRGLSAARNTGMEAATGEIVAYLDDDACPDPHWLMYLAATFMATDYVAVGGPNIAPPGDGFVADCVDNAPGNPVHVLLSDREADHIPGCNMAVRKAALEAIGGFDPQFRIAGDDVDVCWRLQQRGWKLGFNPAAMVWHHRRNSVRTYWKQQKNYGKAEALLERKWPEKYNGAGHLSWAGRVYGKGVTRALGCVGRIYQGTWGSALFQALYQPAPGTLQALPLMPEWYLVVLALAALSALGLLWQPLLLALPLLVLAAGALLAQAGLSAAQASFAPGAPGTRQSSGTRMKLRVLTAVLHLLQPLARLWGHVSYGLTPWRRRGRSGFALPRPRTSTIWSERWQAPEAWLQSLEAALRAAGAYVRCGGAYDRWDLEVRGGLLGAARTRLAIEEHGAGKQLVRLRAWPRCSAAGLVLMLLFAALSAAAALHQATLASEVLGTVAVLLALRTLWECSAAKATLLSALQKCASTTASVPGTGKQPGKPQDQVAADRYMDLALYRRLLGQARRMAVGAGAGETLAAGEREVSVRAGTAQQRTGRQGVRLHSWPGRLAGGLVFTLVLAALSIVAAIDRAWGASTILGMVAVLLAVHTLETRTDATAALRGVRGRAKASGARTYADGASLDGALQGRAGLKRYRRLLRYAVPYWRGRALIVAGTLLSIAFGVLQPWPMKILVDHVLGHAPISGTAGSIMDLLPGARAPGGLLAWTVMAGLGVFAVNSAFDVILTVAWLRVGQAMVYDLARDLFAHIQRRSLLFHSRNSVGDLISRITGDSWCVQAVVDKLIFTPMYALITLTAMVILMASMNVGLMLLSLAIAPLLAMSSLLSARRIRAAAREGRQIQSRIHSHVHQTLSGVAVVQAFTREDREQRRFRDAATDAIRNARRNTLAGSLSRLGSGLATTLGRGVILWLGAYQVLDGTLSVGGLLVFLAYQGSLQGKMKELAGIYSGLQGASASVERVLEILEAAPEVADRPGARPLPPMRGHVRFEHVSFGYAPDRPVLHDVSLDAGPGQTIAIVGATGAGKSTLVSLIPRFFDPWHGRVTVDGHDVRDVQLTSLRAQVALVLQEPFLFPLTIAENIAYGRPDASREEIEAAARAANAHSFIARLPQGYDTVVGERGGTLSGGERQRLSIARALLKDAPILILDEPTSALDAETEGLLLEALERLMVGRTTFIIAHRLSTIRKADCIVVLQEGRIVEQGTHQELLAQGNLYARLHNLQFGAPSAVVGEKSR